MKLILPTNFSFRNILPYFTIWLLGLIVFSCEPTGEDVKEGKLSYGIELNKKTQSTRTEVLSHKEQLAGFTVPEGFVVELVASEEDGIVNPIDMTFDDAGRLWTQTATMYPLDPVTDIRWQDLLKLMDDPEGQKKNPAFMRVSDLYKGKTKGEDKILLISDLYGTGNAKVTTWADGLAIPQSILPYKNGTYVAQGSEMFFLEDSDNDGKSDKRTPLLTGFGFTDTHTMAHVLVRGPGDWIHFSQGALNKGEVKSLVSDASIQLDYSKIARFSLDAKKIELVSSGLNNIWGFQLRGNGEWYGIEANDLGFSVTPMEVGTGYRGIGNDRLRSYQPWMPELHEFRVGGTGVSGLAFTDDASESYPEEWKNVGFIANPITSTINAVRIVRNADGSVTAEHLPDFLTSEDDWFRPVNIEFGPDGSLYVADWYNKIVSHNEVPTTHPDRDKAHGRIWRIRHKSQTKSEITNFYEVATADLPKYLSAPSVWAKRAAWHQISDRPIEETKQLANLLVNMANDQQHCTQTRIHALWSLEGIGHYDANLISSLINSNSEDLRRESIRSLQSYSLPAEQLAELLANRIDDENAMVRSQVLRTLGAASNANDKTISLLVSACKPPLEGNAMGGAYERNFERYLARKGLENHQDELSQFMNSSTAATYDESNLIWASQALSKKEREDHFVKLWKKSGAKELDEPTFIIVAGMLDNKNVYNVMQPLFNNLKKAESYVSMTMQNQAQVQSDELSGLLSRQVKFLIKSKEPTQKILALDAIIKLGIEGMDDLVIPIFKANPSEQVLEKAMLALGRKPTENKSTFSDLAQNEKLPLTLRTQAISILAKAKDNDAVQIMTQWMPKLQEVDQRNFTKVVSNSKAGVNLLRQLFQQDIISSNAFEISSAEKIFQENVDDVHGIRLYDEVVQRIEEEKKAFDANLVRLMAIAEEGHGIPDNGKVLFHNCLLCHRVGNEGQEIAPALDGSAMRDNEALITAIIDPDAALESGYAVYRITKKDGAVIEGYMANKDDRGTTIGLIGGHEQFVQKTDIVSEHFVSGRSFMPKGLIDEYSDEQVADLFAYIKTLE